MFENEEKETRLLGISLPGDSAKQFSFRSCFRPGNIYLAGYVLRSGNCRDRLVNNEFILSKRFPAHSTNEKMLVKLLLFFRSQLARGGNGAEL